MSVLGINASPAINPYRDIHPGYLLIEVGDKYETHQLKLILKNDEEQRETTTKLNVLNDVMTFIVDLKDGKQVDEVKLGHAVDALNRDFPELNFQHFIEERVGFSTDQWENAVEKITRKEKMLLATFNPQMAKLEELISDKNKVHEILAEIIKLLTQAVDYTVRKTGGG